MPEPTVMRLMPIFVGDRFNPVLVSNHNPPRFYVCSGDCTGTVTMEMAAALPLPLRGCHVGDHLDGPFGIVVMSHFVALIMTDSFKY